MMVKKSSKAYDTAYDGEEPSRWIVPVKETKRPRQQKEKQQQKMKQQSTDNSCTQNILESKTDVALTVYTFLSINT